MIQEISIIGSGNVAHHLGHGLLDEGIGVFEVTSRNPETGKKLARDLKAIWVEKVEDLRPSDLVLLAAPDDQIPEIARKINKKYFVAHTSGSRPIDDLPQLSRGIIYPLQTFSADTALDLVHVPFCLEASSPGLLAELEELTYKLSSHVHRIDSKQRQSIHLAAVFACNFSNHMYSIASEILNTQGLKIELLQPLIEETARKIRKLPPSEAQTGPARRQDVDTINKQLDLLNHDPELRQLYGIITDRIIKLTDSN